MGDNLDIILAVLGTGVALAALILTQNANLRRDMDTLRREMTARIDRLEADVRGDIASIRGEMRDLHGRVARIEGVLVGPRPVERPPTTPPGTSDDQEAA